MNQILKSIVLLVAKFMLHIHCHSQVATLLKLGLWVWRVLVGQTKIVVVIKLIVGDLISGILRKGLIFGLIILEHKRMQKDSKSCLNL